MLDNERDDTARRKLANASRRWTEVDYRASGFTKEYTWHDFTPITAAAANGHADVVRFLLETCIADPTLKGCPSEDYHANAFQAAEHTKYGRTLTSHGYVQCQKLLAAAKPFWQHQFDGSTWSCRSELDGYSNAPTDKEAYMAALAAVNGDMKARDQS